MSNAGSICLCQFLGLVNLISSFMGITNPLLQSIEMVGRSSENIHVLSKLFTCKYHFKTQLKTLHGYCK